MFGSSEFSEVFSIMSDIKVSVCVPVYGVEQYMEHCARTLFEQTMKDGIEFIFVNDCTPDKSIEILEKVLKEYPNRQEQVKIIHHEKNGGLVAARNTGLKHASGDYIIHCDSDDWVDLNMYETMYNTAVENNSDVVVVSYQLEHADGSKILFDVIPAATPGEYFKNNSKANVNMLVNKLFRREVALSPDLNCPDHIFLGEDLLRNVQMMSMCSKISFCPEIHYHYYRANGASITRQITAKSFKEYYECVNILRDYGFDTFPKFQLWLQSSVLFSALKLADFSGAEYRKLFPRNVYYKILFLKYIPVWKKVLLAIANISYRMANRLCLYLLKIKAEKER